MDCPKSHLKLLQTSCQGCQTRQELPVSAPEARLGSQCYRGSGESTAGAADVQSVQERAEQLSLPLPCPALPFQENTGTHCCCFLTLPPRSLCLQPHLHFHKTGFHQEAWFWHHLWKLPSFGRPSAFLSRKRRKTQSKIICVRKKNFFWKETAAVFYCCLGFLKLILLIS